MRSILVLGAGRSAAALIQYLVEHAPDQNWKVTVADRSVAHVPAMLPGGTDGMELLVLDAGVTEARQREIARHDLVISMLPASMHLDVVKDCLRDRKPVITPSYVTDELWSLDRELKEAGVLVLSELGLDPGIDHMSAMRLIDAIRSEGGEIEVFESYTGGLIAPESDTNPWGYKFTWNPRNVVLAGQGSAARFIRDGQYRYIPYHRLFTRVVRVEVQEYGAFDGYANRDSLKYRELYELQGVSTLIRGTLRREGFCAAWNTFVQLGCTDDSYTMHVPKDMTWAQYFGAFLPPLGGKDLRDALIAYLQLDGQDAILAKLDWLGIFEDRSTGLDRGTPAQYLQHLLEEKWGLAPKDRDMIVMQHLVGYRSDHGVGRTSSSLVVEGSDPVNTAMARTVGLPMAIAAKLVLNGSLTHTGVRLPLFKEIYDPVLNELAELGISFTERQISS
ncbi:MAG: saccharopine dehydrogenase NADP-binding domain-containing protein [Flavobacteriales bacterium]|nr:saccharopine dehydrogenase NADP-binding domain-containing protein [Flavobacteriales bacterium]